MKLRDQIVRLRGDQRAALNGCAIWRIPVPHRAGPFSLEPSGDEGGYRGNYLLNWELPVRQRGKLQRVTFKRGVPRSPLRFGLQVAYC